MAVTVTVHGGSAALQQEILVGRHRLVADEPVADGGTDAGPTPYDYLLTALGA
jgi:putative redox protein